MAAPMIPPAAARDFLARAGWADADIRPLAGDASFRRYFRVIAEKGAAVLMDAPTPHEDPKPFLAVARHLSGIGLSPPQILSTDLDEGLVLLEDLGDSRMREAVDADRSIEVDVYARAVDLLLDLHRHPASPDLRCYDLAEYQREAGLFAEWYLPAVGLAADTDAYRAAWAEALSSLAGTHSVTVLRDYHAENIMLLPEGRLGLLDFQDALAGHPAYDLVSLLQDARRDVSPEMEAAMLSRYRATRSLDDAAYAVLGAQRNAKILGIFVRLWKRDGKPGYRRFQPRVWRYLERDLAHPALATVRSWFDRNVPASARAAAWEDAA